MPSCIADLGSTNGTFVDGERITDETPLGPGSTIRFGEVSTLFESTDDPTGIQPRVGTRMIEGIATPVGPAAASAASSPGPAATPRRPLHTAPPAHEGLPRWALPALLVALAAILAYLLLI